MMELHWDILPVTKPSLFISFSSLQRLVQPRKKCCKPLRLTTIVWLFHPITFGATCYGACLSRRVSPLISRTPSCRRFTPALEGQDQKVTKTLHQNLNNTSSASVHQDYKDTTTQYSICKASLPQQHFLVIDSKPLQRPTLLLSIKHWFAEVTTKPDSEIKQLEVDD